MRRSSKRSSQKLSSDSQRLVTLAQAVMDAASRIEERAWEAELDKLLLKLLKGNHQEVIDAALDYANKAELSAYDALLESAEAVSESCQVEHNGNLHNTLLIAAPILAWTRFSIASGPVPTDVQTALASHLQSHVLAPEVCTTVAPTLYAIDQLPTTHAAVYALMHSMAKAALGHTTFQPPTDLPETAPFLADTRYLLAVAAAPEGRPLFRWQSEFNPQVRESVLTQWNAQAIPNISRLLPGCGVELLLPEAYYAACREADKRIRPTSVRAAVHYLKHALNVEPNELQAIIGGFGEDLHVNRIDEFRISFTQTSGQDVVYGLVWPLYGLENIDPTDIGLPPKQEGSMVLKPEACSPLEEIRTLLRECGVSEIKHHEGCFPMEVCDDCGAPLYLDPEAELVHAEMPDDVPHPSGHLH